MGRLGADRPGPGRGLLLSSGGAVSGASRRISRSTAPTFVILDKEKRELWRKDTGLEDLQTEEFYRANFQVSHQDRGQHPPAHRHQGHQRGRGHRGPFRPEEENATRPERAGSICYDRRGEELWRFQAGKELRCGGKVYSPGLPDRRASSATTSTATAGSRRSSSPSRPPTGPASWPSSTRPGTSDRRVLELRLSREFTFHDIDGDGREELIVVRRQQRVSRRVPDRLRHAPDQRQLAPDRASTPARGSGPGSMLYYVTVP